MLRLRRPEPGKPELLITAAPGQALDDLDHAAIVDLYKRHGAILFRGFGVGLSQFARFARSFCRTAVVNESPNREPLDPTNYVYALSIASQTGFIPLFETGGRDNRFLGVFVRMVPLYE